MTGHWFKYISNHELAQARLVPLTNEAFLTLLSENIGKLFAQVSGLNVIAVPVVDPGPADAQDAPPVRLHSACEAFADSDYCRESWRLHLAELRRRSETHWHRCDYGMLCAVVPCVFRSCCLAALRLVCPSSMAEDQFAGCVEVLDVLASDFMARNADALPQAPPAEVSTEAISGLADEPTQERVHHTKVLQAIEYIESHLSNPELSVGHIASRLGIHRDYLANLFARQVGQRMTKHIAARRVERAKNFLVTTHWQVKRVAAECGFVNPNWFCHVFSTHTGVAPSKYRKNNSNSRPTTPTDVLNRLRDS